METKYYENYEDIFYDNVYIELYDEYNFEQITDFLIPISELEKINDLNIDDYYKKLGELKLDEKDNNIILDILEDIAENSNYSITLFYAIKKRNKFIKNKAKLTINYLLKLINIKMDNSDINNSIDYFDEILLSPTFYNIDLELYGYICYIEFNNFKLLKDLIEKIFKIEKLFK